jgi:peptidyl-prolyl cis-trans isomerase C
MKEFRRRALESLIDQELAYQYGESLGMKPDRKAVKDGMNRLRKQFPSKKEYETALRRDGITEKELKKRVEKDSVASQAYAKAVTESASISEEALKAYYDDNKEKFQQPEKIRLRMISTKDEVKAKEALARLGKGEDFGDVASKMSEDAYRVKGGDMGFIHKGRLIPELEKAGFGLAPGEISGLINAEGTWFILKHEGTMPSKLLAFDEIKAKLKSELETKRARELKDKWLAELRAKAKIEVLKAD